jgi:hypothetical protein
MHREIKQIDIDTTVEGMILIRQHMQGGMMGEEDIIEISPYQVALLCQWLRDAKKEIEGNTNG